MAVEELKVVCWTISCDRCGEGDNPEWGSHFHHETREDAIEHARLSEWIVSEDGTFCCFDCANQPSEAVG